MTKLFDPDWFRDEFVIFVPDNWTAEQALAIHDLLERLTTAIWNRYEKEILPLIVSEPNERQMDKRQIALSFEEDETVSDTFCDNEIPF